MNRRTSYTGEIPIKEDHMVQWRHIMQALSSLLTSVMGPDGNNGYYLPGPYRALSPAELAAEGVVLLSLSGISIKSSIVTSGVITVRAPLALVQRVVLDAADWGDIGIDGRLMYIVGFLDSDWTVTLPLPPDPGGGDIARQIVNIVGRVTLRDAPPESVLFYNDADINNPLIIASSKERRADLDISTSGGAIVNLPATPHAPPMSSADALLAQIILRSDGAFDLTGDVPSNLPRVANVFELDHHSRKYSLAPRIGLDSLKSNVYYTTFGAPDGVVYDTSKPYPGASLTVPLINDGTTPMGGMLEINFNVQSDGDHTYRFLLYVNGVAALIGRDMWMKDSVWTNVQIRWKLSNGALGGLSATSVVLALYVQDQSGTTAKFKTTTPVDPGDMIFFAHPDN